MKSVFNIIVGVFLLGFIVIWISMMKWGMPWKSYKLTEIYLSVWDYNIWKQQYYNNICKKNIWCFNGELLWLREINNYIYIIIDTKYSKWWSINKETWEIEIKNYDYYMFERSNYKVVDNINDIPIYWYLSKNNLEFYSENDFDKLPENQRKIFEEIENNPSIVINEVNYSK